MPRSGQERKSRRRERRRAAQPEAAISSDRSDGALGDRGSDPGTDSSDDEQRFPMQMLTESPDGEKTTMMDLLMQSVGDGLRSKDARRRRSAERTALQMERANQRDEEFAEELKIKQALLEQKGGHVDNSIPTGVVLLERPCTSMDVWQQEVESAAMEEAEQSKVVGE